MILHAKLHDCIARATAMVALTGAGLSTECGVPDFRSPGSPWLRFPPVDYRTFMDDPAMRREAWRRKFIMDDLYHGVQPGRGHKVLTRLVADGRLMGIITQNIDGLDLAAGVPADKLAQLHGNGTFANCLSCHRRFELAPLRAIFVRDGDMPPCTCGGVIKSATISFGQPMPRAALQMAQGWSLACDLFVVIGSSLLVQPAGALPLLAKRAGAALLIINREVTPLDPDADFILREDIGDVLENLWPDQEIRPQILCKPTSTLAS